MADADFVTIVSSEMIAEVMQEYFNRYLYKKKVEIVDLKPTEAGYMFSLMVVQTQEKQVNEKKVVVQVTGSNGHKGKKIDKVV